MNPYRQRRDWPVSPMRLWPGLLRKFYGLFTRAGRPCHLFTRAGRPCHKSGIVMIEAALALIVLSMGVLTVFLLFARGLERAGQTDEEQQVALFADSVLEGLHAAAQYAAQTDPSAGWTNFWTLLQKEEGHTNVTVAMPHFWAATNFNAAIRAGYLTTNVFRVDVTNGVELVNHALRYRLEVGPFAVDDQDLRWVELKIWPGRFGSTSAVPPHLFHNQRSGPDQCTAAPPVAARCKRCGSACMKRRK
jgi:Tfp pilus assembly protein PilV